MSARAVWFGSPQRPRFGWFHQPADGRARAGVVICPPLGRDYLQAHYALRRLAVALETLGFAVLRFDYDGTGDSAGQGDDPDRVAAWLESIATALELVRGAGASPVTLCGMRLGATLAGAAAARDGDVAALVLWDPCVSGKSFLAEQRALASLSFDVTAAREDGSIETPGLVYGDQTVVDLKGIDLARLERDPARRVLVLTRPDRTPDRRLEARFPTGTTEWGEATGQAELIDLGSPYQQLPDVAVDRIAMWLDRVVEGRRTAVVPPPDAGPVVVAEHAQLGAIVETPVSLGPNGLFGITTQIPALTAGPTVLLLSVANEHHIGPNRLWVELARDWASMGVRSVRFDLSGLGDSPVRVGQAEFVARAPEAFDDVEDAARALAPHDPTDVVLVGLCSAAYQAIESALVLAPRAVLAVNPVLSFQPPEMLAGGPVDARRQACLPRTALVEAFHDEGPLSFLRRRFPEAGWHIRSLAAGKRRPGKWLRKLAGLGVDLLLVCGDREMRQIRSGTSPRTLARLRASGRLRLEFIPGLDHGLLVADHRRQVRKMLTDQLAGELGLDTPTALCDGVSS